ncbi:hypothetical protein QS571_16410, partial [Escherichia coli]|nr:hypothetical protein [Escherichia coli]
IDHAERETTGVEGKAERLTWHKAWTAVSSGFSISYTSKMVISITNKNYGGKRSLPPPLPYSFSEMCYV